MYYIANAYEIQQELYLKSCPTIMVNKAKECTKRFTLILNDILDIADKTLETDDLKIFFALTKISGDNKHDNGSHYTFNQMEDFSHCRLEFKYYF